MLISICSDAEPHGGYSHLHGVTIYQAVEADEVWCETPHATNEAASQVSYPVTIRTFDDMFHAGFSDLARRAAMRSMLPAQARFGWLWQNHRALTASTICSGCPLNPSVSSE